MQLLFNFFGIFQTHYIYLFKFILISDTFGGGRVCLECLFSSFSTDTGCTVELVSSGSLKYRDTFNRRGNTAEGCVSGITAGEYVVRVYDQSSSELVYEVDNVTEFNHFSQIFFMYVCVHVFLYFLKLFIC